MKYIKKIISIGFLMFLVSGCSNKNFTQAYKKMEVSDNGINGYTLDLRIYGTYDKKNKNDIVRIENMQNKQYRVVISKGINSDTKKLEEEEYVLKNNKVYQIKDNKEIESIHELIYKNPNIYLEGLLNIAKRSKKSSEKLGDIEYTVYDVTFKKNFVKKLLQEIKLNDLDVNQNIEGKLYFNQEGYVYKILYNINEITINANYFGVNQAREVEK